MKYYLGNVTQFLQSRNKLEKAVQEFIKKYHRVLIDNTEIEKVKDTILIAIRALNVTYPKCTQFKPSWWSPSSETNAEVKDWVLGGIDCIKFVFKCSKERNQW